MSNISRTLLSDNGVGVFGRAQPEYAAHGIATFPVRANKVPMVTAPRQIGLRASADLASKFEHASGVGFMAGKRSRLTVLDIDTSDENLIADALARHGTTPIITRTGSGNFHAWYRHNGEPRRVRQYEGNRPIDILGGGVVIAPPSISRKGAYTFAQGSLDDLDRLPVMRGVSPKAVANPSARLRQGDGRNTALFQHCMIQAPHCDDFDALLDVACTFASDQFADVMTDAEIIKTARSAWGYQERGENWMAGGRQRAQLDVFDQRPEAYLILSKLRWAHSARAEPFAFSPKALADAEFITGRTDWRWYRSVRNFLQSNGYLIQVHEGGKHKGDPHLFKLGPGRGQ